MTGCTNPRALNYDPSADEDDGSCTYLHSVNGRVYAFQDMDSAELKNKSFTLSYSLEGNSWVFFHDYVPDFYFATRQQLFTLKNNSVWVFNKGLPGRYYKGSVNSFFVDIVFSFDSEVLLNSVQWITQVLDTLGKTNSLETLSHITIWNESQCSGVLELKDFAPLNPSGVSKTLSNFSFNDFSNIVKSDTEFFMKSLFENLRPDSSNLEPNMPWYEKGYLQNTHFIVRLEFDNKSGNKLFIHSADVTAQETYK